MIRTQANATDQQEPGGGNERHLFRGEPAPLRQGLPRDFKVHSPSSHGPALRSTGRFSLQPRQKAGERV
jgi:hypothetical protein